MEALKEKVIAALEKQMERLNRGGQQSKEIVALTELLKVLPRQHGENHLDEKETYAKPARMKKCPKCYRPSEISANYCANCGRKFF